MKSSDEERLARVVAAATAAAVLAAQGQGQNRRNRWGWVSPAIAGAGVLAALIVGLGPYFVPKEDVAAFDDRAVVGEPFEGRMIPGRLHELDALTVTRDL